MTKKVLFVHIGAPKTGSSALQNFLDINVPSLEQFGFSYLNKINIKSAYEITSGNGVLLFNKLKGLNITDEEIDKYVLSYFGEYNKAICSSEVLSDLKRPEWLRLLESTTRLGITLKVICYVRNVYSFFISAHNQLIKRHGEWRSFEEWFSTIVKWQHYVLLEVVHDVLPIECIHILCYDLAKKDLIRSFLEVIGVDLQLLQNITHNNLQINRSLTQEESTLLRLVNKRLGDAFSKEISDLLIYKNPDIATEQLSCNPNIELLVNRFKKEVDWINTTFFNSQLVVTLFPSDILKDTDSNSIGTNDLNKNKLEEQMLEWAVNKLLTVRLETTQLICQKLINTLQKKSTINYLDLPEDFNALSYLLLNYHLLLADIDPEKHFLDHGKEEGRRYKIE